MRIGNKEIKSKQGVWLVDVIWDDGRKATLPTAHRRFFDSATKRYVHNNSSMSKYPAKLKAWKEAIVKQGAVVMTDDDWTGRTPKGTGYSDVFAITDLRLNDDGSDHSFTVTRWL
jgi:hypothetical protein